ncbi:MAG: exosortase C-terminal domain/associated protein EpsI [Myxococcales bacterium]|nr:EpsI family protein [Myxococcales bacterium]HIK86643.1 EpsI family protein [Myxococcales bacterium]
MIKFLAAFLILGLNSYVYWFLGSDEVLPPRSEFAQFPDQFGDWRCYNRETLDDAVINNLRVTDYLSCGYYDKAEHKAVHLYIGYHERQTRDRETGAASAIHPPEHCLPGAGWDVIESDIVALDFGLDGEAKRFVIAKGNQRSLVYFWYHSRGHVIAQSHEKILWMFLDRARRGRTDGSLVRFTIPVRYGDVDAAEAHFKDLAQSIAPLLSEYAPD